MISLPEGPGAKRLHLHSLSCSGAEGFVCPAGMMLCPPVPCLPHLISLYDASSSSSGHSRTLW